MSSLLARFSAVIAILAVTLVTGCATVRHPAGYKEGRPEWTYDVSQVADKDLPAGFDKANHYLFVGAETVASTTEEAARMGALLNAQQQARMFLHSHGETVMMQQIRSDKKRGFMLQSFRRDSEVMRFQTFLDTRADAQLAHVEPVRWYMEEHRPVWRMFNPFPNDTRASRWRAWCVVALPKDICDQVIQDALAHYRSDTEMSSDASPADAPPAPVAAPQQPSAQKKSSSYVDRFEHSAYLGVANIFAAPIELLNQPFIYAERHADENELKQFIGFIEGVPVGVVKGALRLVYGAGSLVVSPLGLPMIPIVRPTEPAFSDALDLM